MKTRNLLPRVYELKTYPGRQSPYVARWVVNGKTRGRSFANKTQANSFRAALIRAIDAQERWSNLTGLPQSMETTGVSVASLVKGFVDSKKHLWEARSRESAIEPLAEMLICLVSKNAPAATPVETAPNPSQPIFTSVPTATPGIAEELKKLAELRDAGILTDEEFASQKAKLLGG